LCITFVIAGNFDENDNKKRVDSVYFETEIKRTERNKQFVMSESTKVTIKRKREITIIHGRLQEFFQEEASSTFCLSFLNC